MLFGDPKSSATLLRCENHLKDVHKEGVTSDNVREEHTVYKREKERREKRSR